MTLFTDRKSTSLPIGKSNPRLSRRGLSIVAMLAASTAQAAANDQPYPVGELTSTMGGAAVAISRDGASPWYNPAGLGRVTSTAFSASLNTYGMQQERTQGYYGTAALHGSGTAIFPGSLGYVTPVARSWSRLQQAIGVAIVIPDFTRHELAFDGEVANRDVHVSERVLEQTLWVVPAWGGCIDQRLCFGASIQMGYWSFAGLYSYVVGRPDGTLSSERYENDYWAALVSGSVGAQWRISNGWWLGGSMRLPARSLWGGGRFLYVGNEPSSTVSPIQRGSDNRLHVEQHQPVAFRLGLGYESGRWMLAGDLSASLSQSRYAAVRSSAGQPTVPLQPPVPGRTDLFIEADSKFSGDDARNAIINGSLGAQFRLNARYTVQAGLFTDFSARPTSVIDEIHNQVNHYGLTLGLGMDGKCSSTYVGIIAVLGRGRSFGYDADWNPRSDHPRATSNALYITLGGRTTLGDGPAPAPVAPSSGLSASSAPGCTSCSAPSPVVETASASHLPLTVPATPATTTHGLACPSDTTCRGTIMTMPPTFEKVGNPATVGGVLNPHVLSDAGKGGLCVGEVWRAKTAVTVYRLQDPKDHDNLGYWWTLAPPEGTAEEYRRDYVICPEWNHLTEIVVCRLKAGALVAVGPGQSATCESPDGTRSCMQASTRNQLNLDWHRDLEDCRTEPYSFTSAADDH